MLTWIELRTPFEQKWYSVNFSEFFVSCTRTSEQKHILVFDIF